MVHSQCRLLRGFCLKNAWAADTFTFLAIALLFTMVWGALEFYRPITAWLSAEPVLRGTLFGGAVVAGFSVMFGFLCLGFSECSPEDRHCKNAYRGRRTPLAPETGRWVENLGRNPRRAS
ncbi:MAG: hypothetical protein KDH88_15405 [Chromatiales bacterium]|nr:hypothetical protein [Chromatiales bacterium]